MHVEASRLKFTIVIYLFVTTLCPRQWLLLMMMDDGDYTEQPRHSSGGHVGKLSRCKALVVNCVVSAREPSQHSPTKLR